LVTSSAITGTTGGGAFLRVMERTGTMQAYGRLAATGGGISVAGMAIDQLWMVAAATGLVVVGAVLIRFGFRRERQVGDA
jgi:hypothetical protein